MRFYPLKTFWLVAAIFAGLLSNAPSVYGQIDESLVLEPFPTNTSVTGSAEALVYAKPSNQTAGGDLNISQLASNARWKFASVDSEINPTLGFDIHQLNLSGDRDTVGSPLPRRLDDISFGIGTPIAGTSEGFLATTLAIGYAGESPFSNSSAWNEKASLIYGMTLSGDRDLFIWIDYDGNRLLFPDMPLPGFALAGKFQEKVEYEIGFPSSSVRWPVNDHLTWESEWDFPDSFETSAEYQFTHGASLYASYVNQSLAFHIADLPNHDRLFYSEQRIELGLRLRFSDSAELALGAGYGFGLSFDEGFDQRSTSTIADVGDSLFGRILLNFQF